MRKNIQNTYFFCLNKMRKNINNKKFHYNFNYFFFNFIHYFNLIIVNKLIDSLIE